MEEVSGAAVAADDLRAFIVDVLRASRMEAECAENVASVLVWADARGIYSHGVTRLPRYVEFINSGQMNPTPNLSERSCSASCVILDADRAAGPHAMIKAADRTIELAAASGMGAVIVKATTHTAALGYYSQRAARSKMVCIAAAASTPLMAYHGAKAKGVSTSPLTIAAYRQDAEPILFDMSAGVVSNGKLLAAAAAKTPLEPGWALDARGNPTTVAEDAVTPLPLGGPKGSGLALMIEIVASLLASNPILSRSLAGAPEGKKHKQNAVILSLDIARFCDPTWFSQEISKLSGTLKSLPRWDSAEEIRLPGERGDAAERRGRASGIPLPESVRPQLRTLASNLGIKPAWL